MFYSPLNRGLHLKADGVSYKDNGNKTQQATKTILLKTVAVFLGRQYDDVSPFELSGVKNISVNFAVTWILILDKD